MDKTNLGDRMKNSYENRTKQYLMRRTPTIIRLDGKSFSNWTKGLDKPFDEGLIEDMQATTAFLCSEIQGAKCGYTQSDEITILLTDFDTLTTSAWFDYSVQKICSVAASLATAKFNQLRLERQNRLIQNRNTERVDTRKEDLDISKHRLAFFDARVFQIADKEEVVNCFLWRQRDAEKNSISMLAQSLYSHKELHQKNTSDMQEMCFQKGYNWNDLHFSKKRGSFVVNTTYVNDKLIENKEVPSLGDLWYQPNIVSHNYPNKLGRLLQWSKVDYFVNADEDWVEVPIEKVRNKWEVVETPFFGKDRNSILKYLKYE